MKFLKLFLLFFLFHNTFSQNKKVCFSIDDLPVVSYGNNDPDFNLQLTDKLMDGLKKYQVPAIGFVNEGKMYDSIGAVISYQGECLEKWISARMDLGNHTLRHKDYNTTEFKLYTDQILEGEEITKNLLYLFGKEIKYFRHPFLHVGATKERVDSLDLFLAMYGYTVAPVTIDNDDYLFANSYQKAINKADKVLAVKIGEEYIRYMEAKLLYYEKQSRALISRNISQILLIHASLLNADYVEKLAEMYAKNGYQFITMDEALEDSAYQTPITKFGKYGISWIDRWALSAGKKGEFFKGDPETPQYIADLSNQKD